MAARAIVPSPSDEERDDDDCDNDNRTVIRQYNVYLAIESLCFQQKEKKRSWSVLDESQPI